MMQLRLEEAEDGAAEITETDESNLVVEGIQQSSREFSSKI